MSTIRCPSCGNVMPLPDRKGFPGWALGCIIAVPALFIIIAVVGLLAAIAIPSFVKARQAAQQNACVNNLRILHAAKEQVAMALQLPDGAAVPGDRIQSYLPTARQPLRCPEGGAYTVGAVGQLPECSVHGTPSQVVGPGIARQ